MGFPMNGHRSLFIRRFNQAKDLAAGLIEPVAQVVGTILLLRLQIRLMSLGNRIRGEPLDMAVDIHEQWHEFLLTDAHPVNAASLIITVRWPAERGHPPPQPALCLH